MNDINKIKQLLTSEFELELFDAALASLNDKHNKLRYNNFAYSIRELSRHFLYNLAPELNIQNCSWYKKETDDGKPSRTQRIKYAIQGGIDDKTLKKWGFNIEELKHTIREIKGAIDSLSKYTHINPEVFNLSNAEIEEKSRETFSSFESFVKLIESYRAELKKFLDGHIEEHMIMSVVTNSFVNVDSLAPHYSLNHSDVTDYHISEINDREIIVNVSGDLYVTLEYGSNRERREGDGLDLDKDFPFETKIRYEIDESFPVSEYEVDEFDVDTSEWYGDDDDRL